MGKKHSIFCSSVKRFIKLECFSSWFSFFAQKTFEQTKKESAQTTCKSSLSSLVTCVRAGAKKKVNTGRRSSNVV